LTIGDFIQKMSFSKFELGAMIRIPFEDWN
jgi:hypothetical protein